MQRLQAWLTANAIPGFALPSSLSPAPDIRWAGPALTQNVSTLPGGVSMPVTSSLFGGPLRERYTAPPGNPVVGGFPCLRIERQFSTANGDPRTVDSPMVLRLSTDAPVVEIGGVSYEGPTAAATFVVDGQLVPAVALSNSAGLGGGYTVCSMRIDFGSRRRRDIVCQIAGAPSFVRVDATDTLYAIDDRSEPQMTVVGDSYLQSRSSTFANGAAIPFEIGARLGIRKLAVDSWGGTGYINGAGYQSLNERLPAHAADQSDIYLVMAGINDYGNVLPGNQLVWPTASAYRQAVRNYLQGLRSLRPEALIVVTAPFSPNGTLSDASYIVSTVTNDSGLGDSLYKASVQREAVAGISGPWIYIDVLMGTGWVNSSGKTGDVTQLQWFTGGVAAPGTSPSYRPGNTNGVSCGGFGGIASVPIISGGRYTQAPQVTAIGGSGSGLVLGSHIDASGVLSSIEVVVPGQGYTSSGLPQIQLSPSYPGTEITSASLGTPTLIVGRNPDGQYPLASFAPAGANDLNNTYRYISADGTHPASLGVEYLSARLARCIYEGLMAL